MVDTPAVAADNPVAAFVVAAEMVDPENPVAVDTSFSSSFSYRLREY